MKASVNIYIEELDQGELQWLLQALHGGVPTMTLTLNATGGAPASPPAGVESAPPAAASDAPPVGEPEAPKAKRGRPRKTPESAPEAGAEAAEAADETPPAAAPKADAPKVTENAVKQAISAAIQAKGVDSVRKVVASFKNAQGDPAAKLSDIQASDYAAVVAALEAPAGD